jgi:hypothetical protein
VGVGAWSYDHVIWSRLGGGIWIAILNTAFFLCDGNKFGTIEGRCQARVFGPVRGVTFISLFVVQPGWVEFVEVDTEASGFESECPDLES